MRRSRGGRGVIGTMATTAVVVGTAGAVSGHQQAKHASKAQQQQAAAQAQQQAQEQAAAESQQLAEMQAQMQAMQANQGAAAAGAAPDLMAQLKQLADMKSAGILDDAEFAAAKAKLLGS